jgi:hypothetical protein
MPGTARRKTTAADVDRGSEEARAWTATDPALGVLIPVGYPAPGAEVPDIPRKTMAEVRITV